MTPLYSKPTTRKASGADRFVPSHTPPRRTATGATEPLSAWQRWEMASFTEKPDPAPCEAKTEPEPAPAPPEPAVWIDEAELARLRLQAQKAGEAEGHRQGYAQGQAEGHAAAMKAVYEQTEPLRALTQALPAALRRAERDVADNLLALALDIARQVLGQALAVDPQALLAVVRDLLQAEPVLSGTPQLVLHPDDVALVKEHLTDDLQAAGWRIRADAGITRGGCRVLASSGELDATLETRWERVAAALARNPASLPSASHG